MASRSATSRAKQRTARDRGPGAAITRDGRTFTVYANDLSAMDTRALRQELGMSFVGLLRAAKVDPDIDLLAAIEWMSRRVNGEQQLEYEQVALEWNYNTDFQVPKDLDADGDASPDADGLPET